MKITCIDKDIKALLESGYYRIPRFQRPYSWERDHVLEFWKDVIEENPDDYFIGSMVLFMDRDDVANIVDGQQRLTTITMLLCALRDAFNEHNLKALAQGVHQLIERRTVDYESQYILSTETSYPYLQEYIQKEDAPEVDIMPGSEERGLESGYKVLTAAIAEAVKRATSTASLTPEQRMEKVRETLLSIRDRVLQLKVIYVVLDNEDDAYLIFETLNTRGKDLAVSDLVKNHLTKLLRKSNKGVDLPKDRWRQMLESFEASQVEIDVDEFLHHFWLSRFDYVTAKKLFKEVRSTVKKSNAKVFLDNLMDDSELYRTLFEPSYRKWGKEALGVRDSLIALNIFRVKQQIPFTLSILREWNASRLALRHVRDALRAIENFHFIFTAVTSQRSSGGISFMFALHARQLLEATDMHEQVLSVSKLKTKIREKIPSYKEFEANFSDILFSSKFTKQKKLVQYTLEQLDRYDRKGVSLDYSRMTIEHLLPQSTGGVASEDLARMGNLILVDAELNGSLANKKVPEKIAILKASRHVMLDDHILNATTWDATAIQKRTEALAKKAYEQVWPI